MNSSSSTDSGASSSGAGAKIFDRDDHRALCDALHRIVRSICPGWLADRRDDLVQASLMGLLTRSSEHNQRLPASYLKKVAYHALIDEIRRIRRRRETPLDEEATTTLEHDPEHLTAADGVLPYQDTGPDPERRAAGRELGRWISWCLERLAPTRRDALMLVLMGHTMPEAAAMLGQDLKQIQNRVSRGRRDLRQCLAQRV